MEARTPESGHVAFSPWVLLTQILIGWILLYAILIVTVGEIHFSFYSLGYFLGCLTALLGLGIPVGSIFLLDKTIHKKDEQDK